ncbi:Ankyrin repeat domain-containing protein 26 [Manis javanica]|nr:Ankyrin repeat domain-containing protein 26 [Manis javanica]
MSYEANNGLTPLLLAISKNNDQMVEFLISKGANIHVIDKDKRYYYSYVKDNKMKPKELEKLAKDSPCMCLLADSSLPSAVPSIDKDPCSQPDLERGQLIKGHYI